MVSFVSPVLQVTDGMGRELSSNEGSELTWAQVTRRSWRNKNGSIEKRSFPVSSAPSSPKRQSHPSPSRPATVQKDGSPRIPRGYVPRGRSRAIALKKASFDADHSRGLM